MQTGSRFTGLELTGNGAINAVQVTRDGGVAKDSVPANLVVDAMGRGSPMPRWLKDHGHGEVRYSRAGIDVHYVSMLLRRTETYSEASNGWVIRPTAPDLKRGATMFPVEGGQWLLALISRFGDLPPLDFEGCLAFVKTVEGGVLYDVIKDAELTSQPRRFMIPEAILANFDEMEGLPIGLLPLGDVIGNFNPVLAQGMTISALHAEILDRCLERLANSAGTLEDVSRRYIAEVVAVSKTAWQSAVSRDFDYPETEGERPPDLAEQQKLRRAIRRIMETDGDLHRDAVKVQQMMLPSNVLTRSDVRELASTMT